MNRSNKIKQAVASLTSVNLANIVRPRTIEDGRANIKRFYGCVNGDLMVMIHKYDRNGERVTLTNGERLNGYWVNEPSDKLAYPDVDSAINKVISLGDYLYLFINIDEMDNLSDLYKITNSGRFNGAYDPSFTLNLIERPSDPLVENNRDYTWELTRFLQDHREKIGGKYLNDAWLYDPTAYGLFANDDPTLKSYGGFYPYSSEMGFKWRWRQINNLHTRYLHWLLLGPFAPYQYSKDSAEKAA